MNRLTIGRRVHPEIITVARFLANRRLAKWLYQLRKQSYQSLRTLEYAYDAKLQKHSFVSLVTSNSSNLLQLFLQIIPHAISQGLLLHVLHLFLSLYTAPIIEHVYLSF